MRNVHEEVAWNVLVGGSAGKYLHEFDAALFGKAMKLYSHSYLNLGLMAVRAAVFQGALKDAQGVSQCFETHLLVLVIVPSLNGK